MIKGSFCPVLLYGQDNTHTISLFTSIHLCYHQKGIATTTSSSKNQVHAFLPRWGRDIQWGGGTYTLENAFHIKLN